MRQDNTFEKVKKILDKIETLEERLKKIEAEDKKINSALRDLTMTGAYFYDEEG